MFARDVSSKIDVAHLSQDIVELWNEWQIRSFMLLSFCLQIFLAIFGEQRKRISGHKLGYLLWLAYLSADWVATFSLGILARSEANSTNPNLIPVFWAAILLDHLGGPQTVTSYSMDQVKELLTSRLLELVARVGVACYVLYRLWSWNAITAVAFPIFISGIIKNGERIWVLRRSQEYNNLSQQPSAKLPCIHIEDTSFYLTSSSDVRYLHEAHLLFRTFKLLFQNVDLSTFDQKITYYLVSEKSAEEAFELIEVELGFKYDRLYSKVATISWPRIIIRFITFLSSISALVSFSIMTKSKSVYSENDMIISYVLLCGVVCLESYSIMMHLLSDWTMIWLGSREKAFDILRPTKCLSPLLSFRRKLKRWSGSMGQHNLLSAQTKKPVNKLLKQYFPGNWNIHSWVDVDKDLKELIFVQVVDKRSRYDPDSSDFTVLKNLLEERGREALRSKDCLDKFGWSVYDAEFTHSLLTWHVATHVCFIDDSRKKCFANHQNCAMSTSLSNYMLYLLVDCPAMLAIELSKNRYIATSIHLRRLLSRNTRTVIMEITTLNKLDALPVHEAEVNAFFDELLQDPTAMLNEIKRTDEGEMSALLDGCMLAMSLQSLESLDGWPNEKKWEMISEVWVEMLMYAASHCGWKEHADALARGGELLTHVCLLMAHLGLSKQCPPALSDHLDARVKRLDDILENVVSECKV